MTLEKLTPNLVVHDVNETARFYCDVLGFSIVVSVPESGQFNFVILQSGGVELMLQALTSVQTEEGLPWFRLPDGNDGAMLYIHVDDVRALRCSVEGHAEIVAEVHDTFYGATEFAIRDPNGYVISFAQRGQGG